MDSDIQKVLETCATLLYQDLLVSYLRVVSLTLAFVSVVTMSTDVSDVQENLDK